MNLQNYETSTHLSGAQIKICAKKILDFFGPNVSRERALLVWSRTYFIFANILNKANKQISECWALEHA